ncbi:hypothetical protein ACQ4PT_023970 [Festuca glaucescens]
MDSDVPPPPAKGVAQPQLMQPFVPPGPAVSGFVDVPVATAAAPKRKRQSPPVLPPRRRPSRKPGSRGALASFVNMLESSAVDIESSPLPAFDEVYEAEEGEEIKEVEEEAFDEAVAAGVKAGASKRSANDTEKEDIALLNACESIFLDAVTSNDQSRNKYWQQIEDKFHQLRPKTSEGASRTMRSLQGRYSTIKKCCSRWAACLEQVKNNPTSGATIDDFDRIAQQRYKDMKASENRFFTLHHCWKILENSENWKLRDQEAPPSRNGAPIALDDDSDDAPGGGRNKGRPDGRRQVKLEVKRRAEQERLTSKIEEMMNVKQRIAQEQLQTRKELAEKKHSD